MTVRQLSITSGSKVAQVASHMGAVVGLGQWRTARSRAAHGAAPASRKRAAQLADSSASRRTDSRQESRGEVNGMAEMNPDTRVYQSLSPNVVYTTPDNGQVHILYGGQGAPDGPGHGHYIYNPVKDQPGVHRPPGA